MNARILVVDDEPEVLELLKTALERQGCEVLTTESAIEAESLIVNPTIDLALLDVGMHGLRLGRKAMSVGKPFILMSGMPVVIEMGELGAVLRKPFKLAEVRSVIERSLARSRREREIGIGLGAA
jgi:two-component system, OmpR family, lantibiotic biosynthesis response regulator NisR/SpaR